uniref:Uncharacterized protein n=1 Tax=Timema bartmani TaxID=61472 RepID=A0A7R9ENR7_9NEOP|nr:unnamed protein product [Timema bartmani]
MENHFGKINFSTPDRDSNLDLPIIGSLVYFESNALKHATNGVVKTTLSTPDRDSNPYLPNIGQPVLHEDDALSRLATEAVTPPAQRVQFILGEDANDGTHTSHPLFSEMEELVHKGNNMEWKETAR